MESGMAEWWGFNHVTDLCTTLQIPLTNCSCDKLTMFFTDQNNDSFCQKNIPRNIEIQYDDERFDKNVALPLLATIVAFCGVFGNATVVWVQTSMTGSKSKHTILITLLAICDLFFAIMTLVYYTPKLSTHKWLYGNVGCKVVGGAHTVGAWLSIGIILSIAVERYFGMFS